MKTTLVFNLMTMAILVETNKTVRDAFKKEGYNTEPHAIKIMKQLINEDCFHNKAKLALKRIFKNVIVGNKSMEKKYNDIKMTKTLSGFFVVNVQETYDGREFTSKRLMQFPNCPSMLEARKEAEKRFMDSDDDELLIEVLDIKEASKEDFEVLKKY